YFSKCMVNTFSFSMGWKFAGMCVYETGIRKTMNPADKIRKSIEMLSEVGEKELVSDLLCALAALTNTKLPRSDLTYSATMRELRQHHKEHVRDFQIAFKKAFEEALDEELENPEQLAMMQ